MTRRLLAVLVFALTVVAFMPAIARPQNAAKSSIITQSYQIAFCRLPGDVELKYWMAQNDGRVTNLQTLLKAHRDWLRTQEPEKHQVTVRAYQQALGRVPNNSELATWNQRLSQGNTNCEDIVNILRKGGR